MIERIYLIDGVRVPRKVYFRRQIFGEYAGASFWVDERRREKRGK